MPRYFYPVLGDYRWAAGHDVALVSLNNAEFQIGEHNWKTSGGKLYPVAISSDPVDAFPLRGLVYSGKERGDGMLNHAWRMALRVGGVKYILDTYFSSGTVASVPMTIYTRRHELDTYARYNCYMSLPKPGQDYTYLRGGGFRVTLRFTNLEAL